jgi:hypothetical protein
VSVEQGPFDGMSDEQLEARCIALMAQLADLPNGAQRAPIAALVAGRP